MCCFMVSSTWMMMVGAEWALRRVSCERRTHVVVAIIEARAPSISCRGCERGHHSLKCAMHGAHGASRTAHKHLDHRKRGGYGRRDFFASRDGHTRRIPRERRIRRA